MTYVSQLIHFISRKDKNYSANLTFFKNQLGFKAVIRTYSRSKVLNDKRFENPGIGFFLLICSS